MSNFSFIETEDGMPDILQHKLDRSGHFLQLIGNILRGPSELSVAERELIVRRQRIPDCEGSDLREAFSSSGSWSCSLVLVV